MLVTDPGRAAALLVLGLPEAAPGGQWAWAAGWSRPLGFSAVAVRWVGPRPEAAEFDKKAWLAKGLCLALLRGL